MISDSILQTLKYSDHFDYPLTASEIHIRLVGANPCGHPQIITAIKQMLKAKTISQTGDYYHLPGRNSLINNRLKHSKYSVSQFELARSLATKLGRTPGVLAIYLTGSLAMSNSSKDSDIDFMVITKDNQLWTTRFLLTIFTSLIGLRRTPKSKRNTSKLCLNLYLSPKSYLLPASKRSLYTAYELIQAVPLYDPKDTHSQLLSANSWIRSYLPNFPLPKGRLLDSAPKRTLLKRNSRLQVEKGSSADERRVLVGTIEFILFHLQFFYMKSKITREYITRDCAFFHPHNPAPRV